MGYIIFAFVAVFFAVAMVVIVVKYKSRLQKCRRQKQRQKLKQEQKFPSPTSPIPPPAPKEETSLPIQFTEFEHKFRDFSKDSNFEFSRQFENLREVGKTESKSVATSQENIL